MVVTGKPARCIAKVSLNNDLIVMASHGRIGLARILLGSVTEKLVRLSPVPVLIVADEYRLPAAKGRFGQEFADRTARGLECNHAPARYAEPYSPAGGKHGPCCRRCHCEGDAGRREGHRREIRVIGLRRSH